MAESSIERRSRSSPQVIGFVKEINSIRALRENMSQKLVCGPATSIYEQRLFARLVSLSRPKPRLVLTSTRSQTSYSSLTMSWNLWVRSSDNVLSSWPYQLSHFCNFWSCWARKNGGSRSFAILHTTYRLTMRLVSAHISQWDVKFAGKWDFALKGNSALRAHVARAVGIELSHSEGQYVIHFLLDMRQFYDSIKAHLLIPQLVARGFPLEILVLGSLTHNSPRCVQVGNGYSDIINGCVSSILAGGLQSCSWARGLLFELVQALEYVVPGSVCEEHIDDLSQFVTNTYRMQLFQDAALIGRAVQEGTAKLGLTLSGKSKLLANDKSLGKLIVGHLGDEGVPICLETSATDLGIETAAGKRRCAAKETHMERQTQGQES